MTKLNEIADKLLSVYTSHKPEDFISNHTNLSLDEAYQVQHLTIEKKCKKFDEKVEGYKVSMTSPETQAFFDANEPAYGTLTSNTLLPDGVTIHLSELNEPLLEVELLILINETISVDDSLETIYEKVDFKPGIEIPDSRFSNWFPNFQLADLIADDGVTGNVIVPDREFDKPSFEEAGSLPMALFLDDDQVVTGDTSVVLEHPIHSLKWLVDKLNEQHLSLEKGMIVSSGSINSPIPLKVGQYQAIFKNFGTVNVRIKD